MNTILSILIVAVVVGVALIIWELRKNKPKSDGLLMLESRINAMSESMLNQLNLVTTQVQEGLKQTSAQTEKTHATVGTRLDNAAKVIGDVQRQLGALDEASKQIFAVGKDISTLQEILRAPKLRGGLGELFLGDLLAQIMPPAHFTLQYGFKSGEKVDAAVKLRDDKLVAVDSKFPLENFRRLIDATTDEEKALYRKTFLSDVKKHIDKIAKLYILPDEGTLDFALMYIPAENIYYETIIKGGEEQALMHYAYEKRVIPVSPNTFYVYMQTIIMGLRGMQVEKSAATILQNLGRLKVDLGKFAEDFTLVGTHLGRARNSYEESTKRFDRFKDKLALTAPEAVADVVPTLPITEDKKLI